MKAVVLERPGPPEVLVYREIVRPVPSAREVLIRVRAFGLNRSELYTRQGHSPGVALPRVLGIEAVGTVEAAPGGQFEVGQRVVTVMGGIGRDFDGGYAEYTCVPAEQVMAVATELDWARLGALPELLQTAWGSLHTALGVEAGQSILIRGGSSSVGLMAAQLGRDLKLEVISTTRNPDKAAHLKSAGATHVLIDTGTVAEQVRALLPGGVDNVLELVGATTLLDSLRATAKHGTVCMSGMVGNAWTIPDFEPMVAVPTAVKLTSYSGENADLFRTPLAWFADEVLAGRQSALIDRTFGFDEVVEAHRYMESNAARGKLVVLVD